MKTFTCECGNQLFFENSRCLACGRAVGFLPDSLVLSALEPAGEGRYRALLGGSDYRHCGNHLDHHVCNWMVPVEDPERLCRSCRLNAIIPNLAEPRNHTLWFRIEQAKRRLLYGLFHLGLDVRGKRADPRQGLAFRFMEDPARDDEFSNAVTEDQRVLTGHMNGTITINIREAEPSAREAMREKMNEEYRTLLGHFRHESGHYYWGLLLGHADRKAAFRALFGDERADYAAALRRYYAEGPAPDWEARHVSPYASAHPWEDWAESWAHYLHMVDTIETAEDLGFRFADASPQGSDAPEFDSLLDDWSRLSLALNMLNRSMGLPDAYPFVVAGLAADKIHFIHDLVRAAGGPSPGLRA
ncbi:MAG TPA: hypothetical protein ENN42_02995 [Thioalkalivibrio sp.]|nr:hypothetical protein [Thioalkalivibrio sp.]